MEVQGAVSADGQFVFRLDLGESKELDRRFGEVIARYNINGRRTLCQGETTNALFNYTRSQNVGKFYSEELRVTKGGKVKATSTRYDVNRHTVTRRIANEFLTRFPEFEGRVVSRNGHLDVVVLDENHYSLQPEERIYARFEDAYERCKSEIIAEMIEAGEFEKLETHEYSHYGARRRDSEKGDAVFMGNLKIVCNI